MAPTRQQYRLVQAIPLIPMGFAFVGSFFLPDSPRWLASRGRHQESIASLARFRGISSDHPDLLAEHEGVEMDAHALAGTKDSSMRSIATEVFTEPTLRSRFFLALAMQTVA